MTIPNDLDPNAILTALGGYPDATCTPLTGGIDAAMWRVDTPDARYALRVLGPTQQAQARVEQAVSRWAHPHGLPVPGIVAAGTWHDRPASLVEWAEGDTLGATVLGGGVEPAETARLGQAFGALQARIHHLPPPTDPAIAGRTWRSWKPVDPQLAARLDAFPDAAPALAHLDYHPLNVLVANGEISAVLDWANAHAGDPRVDLARTLSILQLAPVPEPAAAILRAFEAGWREGYAQVAGVFEIPPLLRWWAGATMEADLAPKQGDPAAPWLDDAHLARIREWTAAARADTLQP